MALSDSTTPISIVGGVPHPQTRPTQGSVARRASPGAVTRACSLFADPVELRRAADARHRRDRHRRVDGLPTPRVAGGSGAAGAVAMATLVGDRGRDRVHRGPASSRRTSLPTAPAARATPRHRRCGTAPGFAAVCCEAAARCWGKRPRTRSGRRRWPRPSWVDQLAVSWWDAPTMSWARCRFRTVSRVRARRRPGARCPHPRATHGRRPRRENVE